MIVLFAYFVFSLGASFEESCILSFLQEIQIFKVVILPEEERGQTLIQTMCFVSRFAKSEFISSDAMSKLRQVLFGFHLPNIC